VINAIVLAAGESRRMGKPKPLLRCGDTTFLERIISVLCASDVDRTTVVLGAQAAAIRASTDLSAVEVVVNEDYRQGQLSSLIAGLRSVPAEADAILLCLVDNPFVTAETVNRVIGAFRETQSPVMIPVFDKQRGHPALFARAVFDDLIDAPPEKGARHVVHSHEDKVLEIHVPDSTILVRIDTPEDYRQRFGVAP
jgi:molybdenum cofactor cytidylyltransferase